MTWSLPKPGTLEAVLGWNAVLGLISEHRHQELFCFLSYCWVIPVIFYQKLAYWQLLLWISMNQFSFLVEILRTLSASCRKIFWHWSQYFQHLIQMIFILWNSFNFLWLEKEVVCHQFKNCTCQWPDVSIVEIRMTQNDLWGSVFPGLNSFGKVFVSKACVTHVYDFEKYLVVQIDSDALPLHYQRIPCLIYFLVCFYLSLFDLLQKLWLSVLLLRDQFFVSFCSFWFFFDLSTVHSYIIDAFFGFGCFDWRGEFAWLLRLGRVFFLDLIALSFFGFF